MRIYRVRAPGDVLRDHSIAFVWPLSASQKNNKTPSQKSHRDATVSRTTEMPTRAAESILINPSLQTSQVPP
jgi:hypothetical protein